MKPGKRERTRSRLLANAIAIFERQGVQATTLAQIAEAAGVVKATLANHFPTKPALVEACLTHGVRPVIGTSGITDETLTIFVEGADANIVAMETAGLTLMRPDPRLVAAALDIARRTLRTIRQNLFWAFVYNVVGIPIAALGLLSPSFAGAAMAASSVCVVSNSLRLRRWRAVAAGDARP